MSGWVAGSIAVGAVVGAGASVYAGKKAGDAAEDAADTAADATREATDAELTFQREQLDYLKEVDKLPRQYREEALTQIGDYYTSDDPAVQQQMMDKIKGGPVYEAIMGGRKSGEESIMRNASATGGLRSGNVQDNLYQYNTELEGNAVLSGLQQQLSGLSGLAGLQGQTAQISNVMGNMGQTAGAGIQNAGFAEAQGQVASGQAWQQGIQGAGNAISSGVSGLLYAKGAKLF